MILHVKSLAASRQPDRRGQEGFAHSRGTGNQDVVMFQSPVSFEKAVPFDCTPVIQERCHRTPVAVLTLTWGCIKSRWTEQFISNRLSHTFHYTQPLRFKES